MNIKYKLPCSCGCGIEVERFVFATGGCRVRAHRSKDIVLKTAQTIETVKESEEVKPKYKVYARCERCKSMSIGKFNMTIYDDLGEHEGFRYLCEFHREMADREGEIHYEEEN